MVYFSEDSSLRYTEEDLRQPVGIQEGFSSIPVCWCFGVTAEMIKREIEDKGRVSFSTRIAEEVRAGNCACEVRNPSGRCCLQDINGWRRK